MLKKNKKGFTLVELLVLMGVIGIMTAVAIVAIGGKQRYGKKLEVEAENLASIIKEAQNDALTGKKYAENQIPCYFLVKSINNTSFRTQIYYRQEDEECADPAPHNEVISAYNLKSEVQFKSNNMDFYYTVPHGGLFTKDGGSYVEGKTEEVVLTLAGEEYTICIYESGQVFTEAGDGGC